MTDVNVGDHYPANWDEFVGQDTVKRQLKIAAKSAKARRVPMGHVMLSSPVPGIGKTSLALLVAKELGGNMCMQSGPVKPSDLAYLFMDLKDGDVLYLDEAHRLAEGGRGKAEWLLHVLQDGVCPTPLGMQVIPKITVIASTTDAGRLPQPILDRFEISPVLEPYDEEDGKRIAVQLARKVLAPAGLKLPTAKVAAGLAQAGNNSPRHMRRILCALRDLVFAEEVRESNGNYDLTEALVFAGVTADGLPVQAQKYMVILATEYMGNPAGQKAIADRLGEVGAGMTELERILLGKGYIALTKQGRMLTPDGMRRARTLAAA